MTKTEFDIKNKVNSIIDELIICNDSKQMLKNIANIMDRVDISDKFNFENQLYYTHLLNVGNIIYELANKDIRYTKSAIREYKENENPIWMDIVKKNVA